MRTKQYLLLMLILFIPIATFARIASESLSLDDNTRADEIVQATQKKFDAKNTGIPLSNGKYFASSSEVSVLFVKNDENIKSIIYHHGEPRGICAVGVINNGTRMVVWEMYSFFAWRNHNAISIKFNGEEKLFDLEAMGLKTKSQFEQYYARLGYETLWQIMWKDFMNCKYFFGMLYL